jgi:hypothetical protein
MTAPDPVRAGRALGGVAAGLLVLEGIATLFVPRGIAQAEGGLSGARLTYLLALAVVLILASGIQRRPRGVLVGTALQVPLLLTGLLRCARNCSARPSEYRHPMTAGAPARPPRRLPPRDRSHPDSRQA